MAERLSVKARQAFVLGVGFFTIVQTVAFNSFAQTAISKGEKRWLLVLAILAIVTLALAAYTTVRAELLISAKDFPTGSKFEARLDDEREKQRRAAEAPDPAVWPGLSSRKDADPPAVGDKTLQPALPLLSALNAVYARDWTVAGKLASAYVTIVDYRRWSNDQRRLRYTMTRQMVGLSIIVTTAELIFALVARLG
jgi:hypothetical protein